MHRHRLGWANTEPGVLGWDGHSGAVDIVGPLPRPAGWVESPQPGQMAEAAVITYWTCPRCRADNDVWGEGAIETWMECKHCHVEAYLNFDPDYASAICP